jgi:hypothetical protein
MTIARTRVIATIDQSRGQQRNEQMKKPVQTITLNGVVINIRYATTEQLKQALGYRSFTK